jgi:ERCC4-related helicase
MAEEKRSDSNWILIYIMCPILVTLSAAAIIYTFKELPKISVLREKFDRQEEQFQKHREYQTEELKKIKKSIAKLAQATGNLDSEMIEDLLTRLGKMEKKTEYQASKKWKEEFTERSPVDPQGEASPRPGPPIGLGIR